MRFVLALVMMTAAAHADESWPTFGNPNVFTEQGGEAIYRSVCAGCVCAGCHMPDGRGASGAGRIRPWSTIPGSPRSATRLA